jgi:outer membrane lipoprotein-sorting protein
MNLRSKCASVLFKISMFISLNFAHASAKTIANVEQSKFLKDQLKAEKILSKYAALSAMTIDIEKVDEKKMLGTKKVTQGILSVSGKKFNLTTLGDRKTEIILNAQKIWLIEHPDADFDPGGKRRVTELSKNQPELAKQIVVLFSAPQKFFSNFIILKTEEKNDLLTLALNPKSKDLKSFKIVFDSKISQLKSIQFVDDIDTQTTLLFKKYDFVTKVPNNRFEFKKLKTDEVF